jgi:CheY-like chemotaxis protein
MSLQGRTAKSKASNPTILIVEDELSVSTSLTEALEDKGYRVVGAKDGLSAMGLARKEKPSAILLDLGLPKQSGLEVLDRLKSDKSLFSIPVIILSQVESSVVLQRCTELGMSCYLAKPHASMRTVIEKIDKLVPLKK